jgi:triosephosphate isomerase (TIM)
MSVARSESNKRVGRMPLIAGNWKMNLNHLEAIALVQKIAFSLRDKELSKAEIAVIPPFTDLRSVQTLVDGDKIPIRYGAQDLSVQDAGAYTGEIGGPMLSRLGCSYVVVGHSERRAYHAEDDAVVAAKAVAAYRNELVPILCVGEAQEIREAGEHVGYVLSQLDGSLAGLTEAQLPSLVIAYEPVWAIGTGKTASADDAQEMCAAIRGQLAEGFGAETAAAIRLLYGGSVKPGNAADIFGRADVDGGLIGGASIVADDFVAIARAAVPA